MKHIHKFKAPFVWDGVLRDIKPDYVCDNCGKPIKTGMFLSDQSIDDWETQPFFVHSIEGLEEC